MCLCTWAEREFYSIEQYLQSISDLWLLQKKRWCGLASVGIKSLESVRKYNPDFFFFKGVYILKGK